MKIVELIDSFTGELTTFERLESLPNGAFIDGVIFRSKGGEVYKRKFSGGADCRWFGVKGDRITDDRKAFQNAVDTCARNGVQLKIDGLKVYLNSYGDGAISSHAGVIELKSNLEMYLSNGAEIIAGTFFDDKPFLLFTGFNAVEPENFTPLYNVKIWGSGSMTFEGHLSQMRSQYFRRIAIEAGKVTGFEVSGLRFENGDLSNCINVGWSDGGSQVKIKNNTFRNLCTTKEAFKFYAPYGVDMPINIDHSTIYANADYSEIIGNVFFGDNITNIVACAIELHGSNSIASENQVFNYLRMIFIAAYQTERGDIDNIDIIGNIAETNSSPVWFWADHVNIENVKIQNNTFTLTHDSHYNNRIMNSYQSLFVVMDKGGVCKNVNVTDNICKIDFSVGDYSKHTAVINSEIHNFVVKNNQFSGHKMGVLIGSENESFDQLLIGGLENSFLINGFEYSKNKVDVCHSLLRIKATNIQRLVIDDNDVLLESDNLLGVINVLCENVQNSSVKANTYKRYKPINELNISPVFFEDASNDYKIVNTKVAFQIPEIPANGFKYVEIVGTYVPNSINKINLSYNFAEISVSPYVHADSAGKIKVRIENLTNGAFPVRDVFVNIATEKV